MKIKRKAPKPGKAGRPAFVVGWSFSLPTITDLKFWFDLEYGGPLKLVPENGATASCVRMTLSHIQWSTSLVCPLPEEESERWRHQLHWGHTQTAAILHRQGPPSQARDLQLFLSRLARGLVLLSEGTSYDVHTEAFGNPSDWKDRTLTSFWLDDHVTVIQPEAEDPTSEWFRTMGLTKFGLDELETARPRGLAGGRTIEILMDAAETILDSGQNPTVGSTIHAARNGLTLHIVSHRTLPHTTGPLPIRRLQW
ncbi:hypothetical protein YTPLAS18_33580 [Nitrospira sp.]|nr:hypothetical protein YTPLAS18_33580 [Nitrospira sp.]